MESLKIFAPITDISDNSKEDMEMGRKVASFSSGISIEAAHAALVHDRWILNSVGKIIFSAIYFAFFTAMLFTHIPTSLMYEQAFAVSSVLAQSGSDTVTPASPMKFYNIGQLGDVFDWLTNSLVPSVFVTQDQNGVDLPVEDWGRIGLFNKALGGVLIEVTSKSPIECPADGSLYKLYPTCHEYQGLDSEYNAYILTFSLNSTEVLASLAEWKTNNWMDASTAEVMVSVLTYNGELEGYVITELDLEFHAGGFVTPKALTRPTISIPYGKRSSYAMDILVWIWWGLAVLMSILSIVKWRKKDKRPSRQKAATQLLGLFIVEVITAVFYSVWAEIVSLLNDDDFQDSLWYLDDPNAADASGTADDIHDLDTVINTLKDIAHYTTALRVIGAVVIALIGVQILHRFQFHPQLNILTRTVANALRQFRSFFVVFIVIFLTFTIIGCMIFGDRAKEFSSLANSMASCINMLFGEFDFDTIKNLQFSVAFYWIYMVVVSLVLMNMMLAIVLDAYEQVSSESYKQAANLSLGLRIQTIVCDILCELRFLRSSRDTLISRGKVRPALLEKVFKEKQDTLLGPLTPQTLRNLFPGVDIRDEEVVATLEFIEHGVTVQRVMTVKETEMKEE